MQFNFNEDQLLFQSTLRDFLKNECTPEHLRSCWETETGRSPELWKKLAELGVPGLLVPEEHEGLGMDEIDLVLLQEEAGRAALAEPLISTAAVGVPLIAGVGSKELSERWLKAVAVGDAILAVGQEMSPFVSDAHVADLLLLPHGDELHAVPRGDAELTRQVANDPSRWIFSVEWKPTRATRVAEGDAARELCAAALDRGALACAAQQLGVTEQLIEMTVAYACERQQFDVPIGSFQAIKHMLANLRVKLEYARPVVHRAAHSVARAVSRRSEHVSMAKLAACEAATAAAKVALQVHGAIGYTWEQDLHIWMRRAWSLDLAWGGGPFHLARVADSVLAEGAGIGAGATFAGDE
jgi:alkylation response protein AidB-like acyl-CoA dehydrogenase